MTTRAIGTFGHERAATTSAGTRRGSPAGAARHRPNGMTPVGTRWEPVRRVRPEGVRLEPLEGVPDVVADRQPEVRRSRDHTRDSDDGQHRDQRADDLLVRHACVAGGLDGAHVRRRRRVHRDQRADADERVSVGIEPGPRGTLALVGQQRRDVTVVAQRRRRRMVLWSSTTLPPLEGVGGRATSSREGDPSRRSGRYLRRRRWEARRACPRPAGALLG